MHDIDEQINIRNLLLLNKRLPKPKQKVITNLRNLPVTVALGCKAEIDVNYTKTTSDFFLIDDTKIFFGSDSTYCFLKRSWKQDTMDFISDMGPEIHLGDGFPPKRYSNHISTPWTPLLWHIEYPLQSVKLSKRKGWCCTMGNKKYQNDKICDQLAEKYIANIKDQWFCYDGGSSHESLISYMFRKPNITGKQNTDDMIVANNNNSIVTGGRVFLQGPWHYESLIELVPETFLDSFMPTEKMFKPIAAGMPFVLVGSQGSLSKLKKMGFKTFMPYLDESYDNEANLDKRIDMALAAFFDFIEHTPTLQHIQDICDHNRKILRTIRTHDVYFQIAKKLRHLITY